ncbi:MAG: hypothetical protein ABSB15_20755 [Bryobacteraceae bacterium]|jgi:hypothetical protein
MVRRGFLVLFWLILFSAGAFAQQPSQLYLVSIGTASATVSSGTIWLYSYSWYGLQKIKLAAIENGRALVPLDTGKLRRDLDPHPNTDAYVLAVQIGENQWYRTPDISPAAIWADLPGFLNSLGEATAISTGTRLILPPPTRRRITMLYPDGRPAAQADISVSVYLYDENHCGFHIGLPLGIFRADERGTFEVPAPLVPLYLDGIIYYEDAGAGPAGAAYSYNVGLKTGPEQMLILKKAWELNEQDYLLDDFELRVLTARGAPRPDVAIDESIRTNTCGGGQGEGGRTDASGAAHLELTPQVVASLRLIQPGGETREVTDDELRELFSRHKLTVRW